MRGRIKVFKLITRVFCLGSIQKRRAIPLLTRHDLRQRRRQVTPVCLDVVAVHLLHVTAGADVILEAAAVLHRIATAAVPLAAVQAVQDVAVAILGALHAVRQVARRAGARHV